VKRFQVALGCVLLLPRLLSAQADTTTPTLRVEFAEPRFVLQQPAALRAPWLGAPRRPPALEAASYDSAVAVVLEADRRERQVGLRLLTLYGQPFEEGEEEAAAGKPARNLLGLPTKYADLSIDGQARLEIRTDRVREERCSPALILDPNSACRAKFKPPSLDNELQIRSTGLLGQRVHVNVDYDAQRDFSGNNNVQVYYEGLEDEIVRRVEVGTVTFQPPSSRFITSAVPATNFGINATFEVGPIQLQTLAATQKGSVVAERTYTIGSTTSQAQDRQLRDLDFESSRFFWVVDPATIAGYPAIDILNLPAAPLPPAATPQQVRVYRYRAANGRTGVNPNLGGITALARRTDSPRQFGPVRWELLIQGTDYYLDASGLWITLATKLDQGDYLAVSYQTIGGQTVGTFPAVDQGTVVQNGVTAAKDTIELIVQPQQGPADPTFRNEMRQVYRVAGADLDPSSLTVSVTLNRSEQPASGSAQTYLQLLGLAIPSDPTVFDRDNRLFPRTRDPAAAQIVHEGYIVLPNLQPFANKALLTPAEVSDSLYQTPLFLLLTQGPAAKFSLQLHYQATGGGDRSTLDLNALQVREGSEQLSIGGRRLVRGVDYKISYDLGQVTFIDPDALFGQGTAQVTARFEERGLFAVAPTTIFGLSTRYNLGDLGAINLLGLYQKEQTAFTRPALGFEASANLIGGVNTELHFKPQALTRFLNSLTSRPATAPSLLDVNAEYAFTKPDPNRSGQAYLEEFEGEAGIPVSMQETSWEFGSRPQQATGLEDILGAGFDLADAVQLTWQNLIPAPGGGAVELRPQDIDTLIRIAGRTEDRETVMYMTVHADTAGGIVQQNNTTHWTQPVRPNKPRWRSMVTSLSSTGVDLTQDEFLEFWLFQPPGDLADSAGLRMVIDLGTVSEDAVALAPDTLSVNGTDSVFTGRQYVGLGRLDTERSSIGIFNAAVDDNGILGDLPSEIFQTGVGPITDLPLCQRNLSASVPIFPWGDLGARCTNGNGVLDTEDLNGDEVLDGAGPNENVFRYIVNLAADSFFVRNGVTNTTNGQTGTWKLYRIPIRSPSVTINTPTLRLVQDLRVTMVTPPDNGLQPDIVARVAMARMRFVGSPWIRRSETPMAGLASVIGLPHGQVSTSIVSTENRLDLGYESPPGIFDDVSQRGGDRAAQGTQINEKSLRVLGTQVGVGERAEAYFRFTAGSQNLLTYRHLRVWFRGRGPGWEEGDLQAFIKVGSDNQNFYLYRTGAKSTTWEPEAIIDLDTWRRLRAQVENNWLRGEPPSGAAQCGTDDPTAYVACEGPYIVNVRDPGINPPNLAAIQEVAVGIYRVAQAVTVDQTELWVDDIRLADPVSRTGSAGSLSARLAASDVGNFSFSLVRENGQFRQINEDPTYRGSNVMQMGGNLRLERFLPASLGLVVPLSATYSQTGTSPELLAGTDIETSSLPGLRTPRSWSATYALSIRRGEQGKGWVTRGLIDPLSLTASVTRGATQTDLSRADAKAFAVTANYTLSLKRHGFGLGLGGIARGLPKWMRQGDLGRGIERADVSLLPTRIRFFSGLTRDQATATAFRLPIAQAEDAFRIPTLALNHLWRNSAGLTWQPLGMLTLNSDLSSTRDLRVYPDSTTIGRVALSSRKALLGIPVGTERDRNITTALAFTPGVASWLRPRFLSSSSFILSRSLSSRDPVRTEDSVGAFILPQTLNNSRTNELGAGIDFARGIRQISGDSSFLGKALARVRPIDVSTRLTRTSTYDLTAFDPSLGYQLGLGGLSDFLTQEGTPAKGVSEARTATVAGGADLPAGISVTLSHALTRTSRLQQVSNGLIATETTQREWPVGSVRWTHTFTTGVFSLMAVGATFRKRQGSSTQSGRDAGTQGALSAIRSSTLTPDLQVSLRNGVSLSFSANDLSQVNASNGNETRLDQNDLTGSLNYAFRMPQSLSRSRKQVRSSVTFLTSSSKSCLQQGQAPDCATVSDVIRKELRGGVDTDLLQTLTGGLQVGYSVNDARHLSRRTSQISIIASFTLSLFAGDYR
jgi:hypothetical protein